jgi:1-acyl-sn-glycerol-3-phosphate acyltransferase
MIRAKHHFFIYPFFELYSLIKIKLNFSEVHILGELNLSNKALLIIANHISWWDGFWIVYLNLKKLHRRFHFMMLREQLEKNWYFKYAGGYSVEKKSRSIIESLEYTAGLLNNPRNMVLMFPQGEINSMQEQEIIFEKGIQRIMEKASGEVQIVFVANMIDYFSTPKPGLYMHIISYSGNLFDKNTLESEYNVFYRSAVNRQKKLSK